MKLIFLSTSIFTVTLCCQLKDFLPCVMQLSAQKVDFNINPVEVIFNINTEARLVHTCRTYGRVFPCFDQKIAVCGTPTQKSQLDSGKRLHSFLCAPFSLQRQKTFLKSSKCIKETLQEPQTAICDRSGTNYEEKLASCRRMCSSTDCTANINKSEVSTCTMLQIENKCNSSEFFGQLQRVLANKEYPIQCQYDLQPSTMHLKKGLPSESLIPAPLPQSTSLVTIHPPDLPQVIDGVVARTGIPIMRRTDPNSKLKPRPTTLSSNPIIKTVFVDEKGALINTETTAKESVAVHKFLPNPYAQKNSNGIAPIDSVRTTRTTSNDIKHTYTTWNFKPTTNTPTTTTPMNLLKPTETALASPPLSFKFNVPPEETSTKPFKVQINWQNDATEKKSTIPAGRYVSPWYFESSQSQTPPEEAILKQEPENAYEAVNPLLDQLKSQSLNLTELSHQANTYFSAAMNVLSETKKDMTQNDPWRTFIDAVAPTIHKVSPDIIPRIREEINRIQPQ